MKNIQEDKTAVVVRYGAIGDMVMLTPVLRLLKEDGYHVTVNCRKASAPILYNNPHVDKFLYHDEKIPNQQLKAHWDKLSEKFDRFINLSESIERGLLPAEGKHKEYYLSHEDRHRMFNVNYYDRTLELSGYPHVTGLNGELYFSREEESWALELKEQFKNRFWILWSLSGSSYHKTYPFAEEVAVKFLNSHEDAVTMTVGDELCRLLEWNHKRNKKRCGSWGNTIRKSLMATKYANLVVATETGIANAAGCFVTPKIIMLSHSSQENLTKYWKNCVSLTPENAACYPCHQLHYNLDSCPLDTLAKIPVELQNRDNFLTGDIKAPICTTRLAPQMLLNALEQQYQTWRESRYGTKERSVELN